MQTKVSTKGHIALPGALRKRLEIRAGDPLDAVIEGGRIVLTPHQGAAVRTRIVIDPVTGLPVLSAGDEAAELSSLQVEELLSTFP